MKKIIILFLTIALLIFMLSCHQDNNFTILKEVKAEEIEERALSDFNITCCYKSSFAYYSNTTIKKVEDLEEVDGMEIGVTNAIYDESPSGNWDFPFLQLQNNSQFIFGQFYVGGDIILVFTFHYSKTADDWGYYTYLVCYVSEITETMTLNTLFNGFENELVSGSYESGQFYSLTGLDVYYNSEYDQQWSFFPMFDLRNMAGINNTKRMYLNPSYLLYNGINEDLDFNTPVATLVCFDMYYSQDYASLNEFNIANYTFNQNLKYKIKNDVFYTYNDVRFPIYDNLYYSFVQSTFPDENMMIWDSRSTTLYREIFNPLSETWTKTNFGYPSTTSEESVNEYFYYYTSQVVPTNYEIIPEPEPEPTPDTEGNENINNIANAVGVIAGGVVVGVAIIPILVASLIMTISTKVGGVETNFIDNLKFIINQVFNAVKDFTSRLVKDTFDLINDIADGVADTIDNINKSVPKGLAIGVGVAVAVVLLGLIIYVILLINNRRA